LANLWINLSVLLLSFICSYLLFRRTAYFQKRACHLEDLKGRALKPFLQALQSAYAPLLSGGKILRAEWAYESFDSTAKITEQAQRESPRLSVIDPGANAPSLGIDSALFLDARSRHYRKTFQEWETFRQHYTLYANECKEWVQTIGNKIVEESSLAPFGPNVQVPYVMQYSLAVFIYERLMQIKGQPLKTESARSNTERLTDGRIAYACAGPGEINNLIELIERLCAEEKQQGNQLKDKQHELSHTFTELAKELGHVIASQKLPRRCDLVGIW